MVPLEQLPPCVPSFPKPLLFCKCPRSEQPEEESKSGSGNGLNSWMQKFKNKTKKPPVLTHPSFPFLTEPSGFLLVIFFPFKMIFKNFLLWKTSNVHRGGEKSIINSQMPSNSTIINMLPSCFISPYFIIFMYVFIYSWSIFETNYEFIFNGFSPSPELKLGFEQRRPSLVSSAPHPASPALHHCLVGGIRDKNNFIT